MTGITPFPIVSGSSPLARGTHHRQRHPQPAPRFIPARTGNTVYRLAARCGETVHPRSHGEHRNPRDIVLRITGSSPLARGTPESVCGVLADNRFIPARTGNTIVYTVTNATKPVHPRSHGEHCETVDRGTPVSGSSPLARGTLSVAASSASRVSGSSPLARGTPRRRADGNVHRRFIPARTGNTSTTPTTRSGFDGSSPLARGTRPLSRHRRRERRFIPARTGNTDERCV